MKIDWSTYKITLLLYFGILLLPISFYFSYSSLDEIKSDTGVLNSLTLNSGSILSLGFTLESSEKEKIIENIDRRFQDISQWMAENDGREFYVGSEPLLQSYDSLLSCWLDAKTSDKAKLLLCWNKAKSLNFSIKNMLKLKQNRMHNILYINVFVAMALLLSLVFLVRAYIHKQLKKHAFYDFKTKLYTKDYLLAIMKELTARTMRNKDTLFVLYIDVQNLKDEKILSKKEKNKILEHIGKSLLNSIRNSDIACRYSGSEFIVVLPNMVSQNIEDLINRIDNHFINIEYTTKTIEHYQDETYDDFVARFAV